MKPQPTGWAALVDTITAARQLDRVITETHFTRDALRAASDHLAATLADWLTVLNNDVDDQRTTTGPMLSTNGLVTLRDMLP